MRRAQPTAQGQAREGVEREAWSLTVVVLVAVVLFLFVPAVPVLILRRLVGLVGLRRPWRLSLLVAVFSRDVVVAGHDALLLTYAGEERRICRRAEQASERRR